MRHFKAISLPFSRTFRTTHQNPTLNPQTTESFELLGFIRSKHRSPNSWFQSRRCASSAQESKPAAAPPERVSALVDEISVLTLLEVSDLTKVLKKKLGIEEMPIMAVMMPGMGFGGVRGPGKGGAGGKEEAKVAEKTIFDLKLESVDEGAKLKVVKEVRAHTDLGLMEAKKLVEKAPTVMKKGVTKEEAENIIKKMKEVGAKVSME